MFRTLWFELHTRLFLDLFAIMSVLMVSNFQLAICRILFGVCVGVKLELMAWPQTTLG